MWIKFVDVVVDYYGDDVVVGEIGDVVFVNVVVVV